MFEHINGELYLNDNRTLLRVKLDETLMTQRQIQARHANIQSTICGFRYALVKRAKKSSSCASVWCECENRESVSGQKKSDRRSETITIKLTETE